jgi:hypothetical protein
MQVGRINIDPKVIGESTSNQSTRQVSRVARNG